LSRHDAFNRAHKLIEDGSRHAFAERLDRDVTSASLAAEKQYNDLAKRNGQSSKRRFVDKLAF
jgi:hypothetical protein